MQPLDELLDTLTAIEDTENRLTIAAKKGTITTSDIRLSSEGLLLRGYVALESFVREHFFSVVRGEFIVGSRPSPLENLDTELVGRLIYLNGKRMDWLPISEVEQRAELIVPGGNPFARLRWRQKTAEHLETIRIVRNRVAHSGEEALRAYTLKVAKGESSYTEPGAWLVDESPSFSNGITNIGAITARLRNVGLALAEERPDLDTLLGPATKLESKTKSIVGKYRCLFCGDNRKFDSAGLELGKCPSSECPAGSGPGWEYRAD